MAQLNMDVFKVPLGFIKALELLFAIIAFATVSGWSMSTSYTSTKADGCQVVNIELSYPFNFPAYTENLIPDDSCSAAAAKLSASALIGEAYKSTGEFFVFTGVISFLFVLAMTVVYLMLWQKYESDNRYPIVDLICTSILAVFWLFAAITWAFAAGGIKGQTNKEALTTAISAVDTSCKDTNVCTLTGDWGYGSLAIGALAAFVCLLLFCTNVWFVYKETVWFRNRTPAPPPMGAGPSVPDGPPVV